MKADLYFDIDGFFIQYFKDPRREHGHIYTLPQIMFMVISAILADCVGWNEVEDYCRGMENISNPVSHPCAAFPHMTPSIVHSP